MRTLVTPSPEEQAKRKAKIKDAERCNDLQDQLVCIHMNECIPANLLIALVMAFVCEQTKATLCMNAQVEEINNLRKEYMALIEENQKVKMENDILMMAQASAIKVKMEQEGKTPKTGRKRPRRLSHPKEQAESAPQVNDDCWLQPLLQAEIPELSCLLEDLLSDDALKQCESPTFAKCEC
jgi:regulator of replication initiation timing